MQYQVHRKDAYKELKGVLAYIDSLQEEPVSIDFEKELYKAFGRVKDFTLGIQIAKWFYDMGKNSQEPVREELEKAAVEWFNSVKYKSDLSGTPIEGFKAGANWQEQQLVKVAVEIPIVMVDKTPAVAFSLPDTGLKKGDKIKVIAFKSKRYARREM